MLCLTACRVAIFSIIVARSQTPPSQLHVPSASSDVVQGISGLMQRVGQLQPQLRQLPETDVARLGRDGQRLHERFLELQEKLRSSGAQVGFADEGELVRFHGDLALFVQDMENHLGIVGPAGSLPRGSELAGRLPPSTSLAQGV
jgi:hypothetical protein